MKTLIGFKELIQRPVLLEMTIKTLPKLIQEGGTITRPRLYDTYLRGEIARQQVQKNRDFLISDINYRLSLLQLIASYLYTNKRTELTVEQIKEVIRARLSSEQRLNLDAYLRDLIACSFLIREGDQYRFSHFSFLEYLVALKIRSEILDKNVDLIKNIQIPAAVRSFLREILMEEENRGSLVAGLEEILNSVVGKARDDVQYLGGNSITLLAIMDESLEGANFSNMVISGAYLAKSSLMNTKFISCDLRKAEFTGANCQGVDFSGSNLCGAIFAQANISEAVFNSAIIMPSDFLTATVDGKVIDNISLIRELGNFGGAKFDKLTDEEIRSDFVECLYNFQSFRHTVDTELIGKYLTKLAYQNKDMIKYIFIAKESFEKIQEDSTNKDRLAISISSEMQLAIISRLIDNFKDPDEDDKLLALLLTSILLVKH